MARQRSSSSNVRQGFSLIELVIVVIIIAIIGAIALPRMSRGAQGAADSALRADLNTLRSALDRYATEHGGKYPTTVDQLAGSTDDFGTVGPKDSDHPLGPYLRAVPDLPVGEPGFKGSSAFVDARSAQIGLSAGGWYYNPETGDVKANVTDGQLDSAGKRYNLY
jgi:general secretion pathway protein G